MGFARIPRLVALPFVQVLLLNACGDGSAQVPTSYSIDGTVSGLNSGSRVVLQNNGGSNITVSNNGMFSFPAQSYAPEYSVTVLTQSTGQTCTVISGTGTVVSAKVSNVRIVCGPATESVLYSFRGGIDGALPNGLIQGRDGNFYGTTLEGGGSGDAGTLFKVTPTGVEKVLYSFQNSSNGGQPVDGVYPTTGLIQGSDGNFYGTTSQGGGDGNLGTVFKVTPEGVETVLYSFASLPTFDQDLSAQVTSVLPSALIQGSDGNYYGTTTGGGEIGVVVGGEVFPPGKCCASFGTVFRVTPEGVETVVYSFLGGVDGDFPVGGLIQGSDGNFYGTTSEGGGSANAGAVFKVTTNGVETLLYSFQGGVDGASPNGLIQGSDGNFYGTTSQGGGSANAGTVFQVTTNGVETLLYSFQGGVDGASPNGLIQGSDGNFYGTTSLGGGSANAGTVFKVTTNGVETVLYSFHGGLDGTSPNGLIQGSDGNLYGTTFDGGSEGNGTVFKF